MVSTTTTPSALRAHHRHDIDPDVEPLAVRLTATEDPAQRALLVERIVLMGLPLADALARRYRGRGIEDDDLRQVARTALVQAVNRYRPGAGTGFAAYASPSISGEIKRWFRDHGWSVRPPRRVQELRAHMVVQEESMRHDLGRNPSDTELAASLEVEPADVAEARSCSAGYHAASLDAATLTGTSIADRVLVQDDPCEKLGTLDALRGAVTHLSDRQRLVVKLRYVDELTQSEIGQRIGVSQMQVSRILREIITSLRAELQREEPANADAA